MISPSRVSLGIAVGTVAPGTESETDFEMGFDFGGMDFGDIAARGIAWEMAGIQIAFEGGLERRVHRRK